MRRFLFPTSAVLLSLFVVSTFLHAEDAPRAPRSARRAARRAAREAETRTAARNGLSGGLSSAGRHALPTPRLVAQKSVFDQSEIIVFTSNANPPAPCRPVNLREDLFPVTSESNLLVAAGNIIQSEGFLESITSVGRNEGRFDAFADEQVQVDVLSRVVVAGELAGLVLPEPGRLDPSILQASSNQLPVAAGGAIVFAQEAPPPLPPREQTGDTERAAEPGDGFVLTLDQIKSVRGYEAEARIQAALDQPVSLHFKEARLSEIFRHVANSQGINIVVDDTGLAEEGVTAGDAVSIEVDGVMLRNALGQILSARNLAFLVEDEVLKITSRQRSEGELFTHVYAVRDLIGGASASGPSRFDLEGLVELIQSTIRPDSWDKYGGEGVISPHPGSRSLVVRQTRRGHEEIASLLEGVRQFAEHQRLTQQIDEIWRTSWEISDESSETEGEQCAAPAKLVIHPATTRPLTKPCAAHFDDAPLGEVLRHLADENGISFHIDVAGLAAEGVTLESPVSIHVDGIQIKSALKLILMPLNLEFQYWDGFVSITGRDRQTGELTTRVYPVADLMCPGIRFLQQDVLTQGIRQPLHAEALTELISCTLDPNGWEEFGGQGRIVCHEPTLTLVVHQTPRVHQEIADLLAQLRQFREAEISLEMSAIRISRDDFARIKTKWGADWYGNRVDAAPEQIARLTSLLARVDQTTVVRPERITMYEGQTWRVPAASDNVSPFAYVTAIPSADRRGVDCNIAVPRTIDAKQMLQRVTVFMTTVGNTCVVNASERSPVIENYAHFGGVFSDFGAIRELAPGEGDGVVWDESPDGVTLVFITPRIIVREEEEERFVPAASTSESGADVEKESPAMITVTPRIIVQEEEEALLGIPLDPPSTGPRPDQSVMPPASWDLFGIPTHDLLFREEEPERRLILQNP